MRILSIAAGAGGMYCGSCLRDNALAAELLARGHDVTLQPLYTPLLTDDSNVTRPGVLFGGISVYLQHYSTLFGRLPRVFDRLLDSPQVISAFANRAVSTNPRMLGGLTISVLEGREGRLRKEFDKLIEWAATEPKPDIVSITNSMLIGLARPLAEALQVPVCCTLQGEDLFLENLQPPYRQQAIDLIRQQVRYVDRFVAVSHFYSGFMSRYLQIAPERMSIVPLGIKVNGFEPRTPRSSGTAGDPFRIGFMARIAPEKGLQVLAAAFVALRKKPDTAHVRLEAAGHLAAADKPYLDQVRRDIERAGLANDFVYHGVVDRDAKTRFLRTLDVTSLPATYDEPKGLSVLESMACGVPVVQPRRGSFVEMLDATGGGLLVDSTVEALTEGLYRLFKDQALRETLGRQGADGVRAHYTVARMADRLLEVYADVLDHRRSDAA